MPSLKEDRAYLCSAAPELENYLLSKDLYRPLPPGGGFATLPSLTVGNILLAQARCLGIPSDDLQADVKSAIETIGAARTKWLTHWRGKARQEAASRSNLWGQYLEDLIETPHQNLPAYAYQVRNRAICELLNAEYPEKDEAVAASLAALDSQLKAHSRPGAFIWEGEIEHAFAPDRFWFLFVSF